MNYVNFQNTTFQININLSLSLYIYIYISCLTVVEGDPKASFSIVTTPRCRGGRYSFLWIAPLTLDLYLIMLSAKQEGIKYNFWVFGMTRPGIELRFPGPLASNLTIIRLYVNLRIWKKYSEDAFIYIYIYIICHCLGIFFVRPSLGED